MARLYRIFVHLLYLPHLGAIYYRVTQLGITTVVV